jgi:hypothetical protein
MAHDESASWRRIIFFEREIQVTLSREQSARETQLPP